MKLFSVYLCPQIKAILGPARTGIDRCEAMGSVEKTIHMISTISTKMDSLTRMHS
jgi:hypothetical protein